MTGSSLSIRLAELSPEHVASQLVQATVERVLTASPGVAPLLQIRGPHHDLPSGVPEAEATARSWVYGCSLGCDVRDLVLYAQGRLRLESDSALVLLTRVRAQLILDRPEHRATLELLALAATGRVLLASGGAVAPRMLAALGGVSEATVAHLIEHQELRVDGGCVVHADAVRWLRVRGVRGL